MRSTSSARTRGSAYETVIVGGGFAGSLLARILARHGRRVLLLERGHHPRFALGESTTPLANLALERIAVQHGFEDLWSLAAWGRWKRDRPDLRCGRKRGFTFYVHEPGRPFDPGPTDERRLLVAASPDDQVADTQWHRADVDAELFRSAALAGATTVEGAEVRAVERREDGLRVIFRCEGVDETVATRCVVDATGAASPVARSLGVPPHPKPAPFRTRLVFGHFEGVPAFADVLAAEESSALAEPYPETWAAVHHVTEAGWLYQLRFDDGRVSAGHLVIDRCGDGKILDESPERAWARLLEPHPLLQAQFAASRPVRPLEVTGPLQRRLQRAVGSDWALLPHTYAFFDPLFSTGIAWSLLGVERLADVLLRTAAGSEARAEALGRYDRLLHLEADHLARLIGVGLAAMPDAERLFETARVYFVAASWEETRQRLFDPPSRSGWGAGWAWEPFLAAGDGPIGSALAALESGDRRSFERTGLRRALRQRDVAGLLDPARGNLHPVDLETPVRAASLLGLDAARMRALLPRLRSPERLPAGPAESEGACYLRGASPSS